MQVANDLWNQQAYGIGSSQNKSQSVADFADIMFKNLKNNNNIVGAIELSKEAIFNNGTFTRIGNQALNFSVYYSENHSSDNPVYVVKGKNIDGTRFETEVNVNDVDPRNASVVEMQALLAHFKVNGQTFANPFLDTLGFIGTGDNAKNANAFTKLDFLTPLTQMMECQEVNGNWEKYHQCKKLIDALIANEVSKTVKTTETSSLTEAEKLEAFKKEIWNEIDSWPWSARHCGYSYSIQITDDAFKRMMEEPEFKNQVMSTLRQDGHSQGIPGAVRLVTLNITKEGYSGYGYTPFSTGETDRFTNHSKGAFWVKKADNYEAGLKSWLEKVRKQKLEQAVFEQKMFEQKSEIIERNEKHYNGLLEAKRLSQREIALS